MNRGGRPYQTQVERTRALVEARVKYWSAVYGIPYRKIFIKKQKRRWGSASEAGNLNFNYRLGFLPLELVDYVVIHELCHLRHLNHSRAFWELVGVTCPDAKLLDKRLNTYRF
jgi:hypothetical protein